MATPKYAQIAHAFMNSIGDPIVTNGDGLITTPGKVLQTKEIIESFINRAIYKLFITSWGEAKADKDTFLKAFPELMVPVSKSIAILPDGTHSIATPNLDLFEVVSASASGKYVTILDQAYFALVKSKTNAHLTGTDEHPILIKRGNTLYLFKDVVANPYSITIDYIRLPLNGTDGSQLVSGGAVDSPFGYQWTVTIAEIAKGLFLQETNGE